MTRTSIPRIRAVRFKAGGEVRLLPSPREAASNLLLRSVESDSADLWRLLDNKIAGYALVVWTADGETGGFVRIEHTSPYVGTVIPHIVTEAVRRVLNNNAINRALGETEDMP